LWPLKLKYLLCTVFVRTFVKTKAMEKILEQEGKARFDTRLPRDKKLIIEKAALLGGYKNLSDFVVTTVYEKAQAIIQQSETILASQRDNEIFFDALVNPPEPNDAFRSAASQYKKQGNK
jgi:uncharacterized protein (DUF1778 family)